MLSMLDSSLEKRGHVDEPFGRRWWLYRRGFFEHANVLYDLETNDHREYLSHADRFLRTSRINQPYADALNNKLLTYWSLGHRINRLPELFGVFDDGRYYPVKQTSQHPLSLGTPSPLRSSLITLLERERAIVVKGTRGGGGQDVLVCSLEDGLVINGEPTGFDHLEAAVRNIDHQSAIVTEHISQGPYADRIYPESTNTIRLLTMLDPESGEPFIGHAVHRFGTPESGSVDNWSRGGLSAAIDTENGELGPATRFPYGGSLEWYEYHPSTGERIAGVTVPGWDALMTAVLSYHRDAAVLKYIGWDVVLTDPPDFSVIELNSNTDIDFLQVHSPLLAPPRNRRFYEHHGIV